MLSKFHDRRIRVFVVWEHVLASDIARPGAGAVGRLADAHATQFWDPGRSLSKLMGEQEGNRKSIVWDWVGVYPPGARWEQKPPDPSYHGRPVEDVVGALEAAIEKVL